MARHTPQKQTQFSNFYTWAQAEKEADDRAWYARSKAASVLRTRRTSLDTGMASSFSVGRRTRYPGTMSRNTAACDTIARRATCIRCTLTDCNVKRG